ncbi:DNA repair protein RadA/Sms [Sporobacter termitidis DSM 10068]|uniref:DNA repair protein RadA n=1 Tax=Sporobacter termitidis DSM 10068 TaxID=1123282 RepID=A0A1M5TGG4_9FIRM|nr:DNA repair protein RadA [Sporobacter termitidis]SHH49804.1 DNA repair protein RadA/Sms [Sporobacter termitidis DSM 10068]
MKGKTAYFCTECGNETPKWQGKCAACGSWNTIVEQPVAVKTKSSAVPAAQSRSQPKLLGELDGSKELRFDTGLGELDRVLGGGAVTGSLVLVGGAPGIGKSTLLLQICGHLGQKYKILYVTGEESERQLKMRAERLHVKSGEFYVYAETELNEILTAAETLSPDVMIIDSIQTLYNPEMSSSPGSVGQVKECTMSLLQLSKSRGITIFLIGHVNKEGAIAGPKVLEHMVDCVLYFEGEQSANYRMLRAAKNRFGSTNELGVFEMRETGLVEVANPSELLLSGRPLAAPGTCVTCVMEGTRPILAEVQALVAPSCYNVPRRNSNGIDYNRAMMLLAVLEKRSGLRVSGCDAYINVIGGLTLDEPSADLAAVLALASSFKDMPVGDDLVAIGEVGLTGELRPVTQMSQRLSEIARLGFKRCLVPKNSAGKIAVPDGLRVVTAKSISEAVGLALG